MILTIKKEFNLTQYKETVGTKTNIHKVSFFHKKNLKDIIKKRILFIDLEFSMNKHIFEVGGFILENGKIKERIFREYSLPKNEPYYSFDKNGFVTTPINTKKEKFNEKEWLVNLLDSVDYIVVHNYTAEASCFFKILFPKETYNIEKLSWFREEKIICTNYTFKNKYFKNIGIEQCSNSELSATLGWEIKDNGLKYEVMNKALKVRFEITKEKDVVSKLHNSYYDAVITLTNFLSALKLSV